MYRVSTRVSLPVVVLSALALLGWPASGEAATFAVDSTADAVDSSPGDGLCDDGAGSCTLRAAVMESNALAGADTVTLPDGTYVLTIAGSSEDAAATGDLDITQDLVITGGGQTTTIIDGGALDTVLHVDPVVSGVTASVSDLTIRNGSNPSMSFASGGVLNRGTLSLVRCDITQNTAYAGGGIYNTGVSLTVDSCAISGNTATGGYGGGVANYTSGTATLTDTTVSGNTAGSQGGAGIGNYGTITLDGCLVSANSCSGSSSAAGVMNGSSGVVDITDTTISGNDGGNGAGGIHNSSGTMTVTTTTISGNHGAIGIRNRSSGTMTLVNSTVSGNYGGLYNGGAIINQYSATLNLRNSTVAYNQGPTSTFAAPASGGITTDTSTVNLRNSIVASNSSATGQPDCLGTLISEGHNLVGSLAGCTLGGDPTGNVTGQAARLSSLQDNGGPTFTHALGTISPAIDAGNPAAPGSGGTACEAADQRGVVRPIDGDGDTTQLCDMGAYETSHIVATYTVNSTGDTDDGSCDPGHCTLREAILASNATSTGMDTIAFDIPGAGPHTIQPLSPLPNVVDPVVIDGYTQPGASTNSNGPGAGSNASLMVEIDGTNAGTGISGLRLTYGGSTVRGLVVNRFVRSGATGGNGIELYGYSGNSVEGCFLGTDPSGTIDLGNQNGGVFVYGSGNTVGGTTPAARNVISGNDDNEVHLWGSSNVVQGNFLGTDLSGTTAVGLGGSGINLVAGSGNTIGGDTPEAGNLISGNGFNIEVNGSTTGTAIVGNTIGPDLTGTASLGSGTGIYITQQVSGTEIGGSGAGEGNLISAHSGAAVQLMDNSTGTVIRGNLIGTAADGTSPLGNGYAVRSFSSATGNRVGGGEPGAGNVIAFNGAQPPPFGPESAVVINAGTGFDIQANRFFDNPVLGIDLGNDGVTPNDAGDGDSGPNNLQNFPVLITVSGGGASIEGTLNSTPSTQYRLDFFASSACDASGYGEGETFLGSHTVTTDASGDVAFVASPGSSVPAGSFATATATDPDGNTSEFSACHEYDPPHVDLTVVTTDGDATGVPGATVAYTLSYGNAGNVGATGVVLTDTVPTHSTLDVGASTAGWGCTPDTSAGSVCTLALGSVAGGGGGSATFAVVVDDPIPAGVEQLSNTASIADDGAGGADTNPSDNTDSDTTPVDAAPNLGVTKDDGGAQPLPGETLLYTLTYVNGGNQDATGVALSDAVPDHTTFDPGASTAGWACVPDNNAGSSCTLSLGSLAGSGGGGSATFAVVLDDPWTPGVTQLSNTASVADDGANGADPDPADNTDTVVTDLDATPPTVSNVDTVAGTGDGELEECESAHRVWITHLLVTFSEAVLDPVGDSDPHDVTNPANYLLVAAGPDLEIDTLACGAVAGDDVVVPAVSVAYDAGTDTATLDLGGGLDDSVFRLLVCGSTSIRDLFGNSLDGDGDGAGGDDFALGFRVDVDNLFDNGHLDCSLGGFTVTETIPGAVNHSFVDADGSTLSGSAEIYNPSTTGVPESFTLGQCMPLAMEDGYYMGLLVLLDAEPGVTLTLTNACELFDAADCLGATVGLVVDHTPLQDTAGAWLQHDMPVSAPAASVSTYCSSTVLTDPGSAFTANLDHMELMPSDEVVFVDGFETGDLSVWSGHVPTEGVR